MSVGEVLISGGKKIIGYRFHRRPREIGCHVINGRWLLLRLPLPLTAPAKLYLFFHWNNNNNKEKTGGGGGRSTSTKVIVEKWSICGVVESEWRYVAHDLTFGANWSGGLGGSNCSSVFNLSLGYIGSVLNLNRCYQIGNWCDRQIVGQNTEASMISCVGHLDLLTVGVDVSPSADHVARKITIVCGSLSGVSITKTGLAKLVLSVPLH